MCGKHREAFYGRLRRCSSIGESLLHAPPGGGRWAVWQLLDVSSSKSTCLVSYSPFPMAHGLRGKELFIDLSAVYHQVLLALLSEEPLKTAFFLLLPIGTIKYCNSQWSPPQPADCLTLYTSLAPSLSSFSSFFAYLLPHMLFPKYTSN